MRVSASEWLQIGGTQHGERQSESLGDRRTKLTVSRRHLEQRIAPGFKNKTRYTPYMSLESQISYIATNRGNINRQCLIYNILNIKDITLDNKQQKDNSDLQVKTQIPQGQLTG